jgi:hypothetical protein
MTSLTAQEQERLCISKVALELNNKPELIDYIKEQAKENNRILRSLLEE